MGLNAKDKSPFLMAAGALTSILMGVVGSIDELERQGAFCRRHMQ
jgi:hypothetical protein